MNSRKNPVVLYGVPFSQPVRAVMWLMLYKQLPFEMVLINPGSKGENGSRNPAYLAKNPGGTIPMIEEPKFGGGDPRTPVWAYEHTTVQHRC